MVELTARLRMPGVHHALRRGFTEGRLPLGLAAGLVVGGLGFANGGYFPVAWGWSALGLLWLVAIALVLGVAVEIGVRELIFLGALAALTAWVALSLLWTTSVPGTVLETERTVVYLAAGLAGILLLRRRSASTVLLATWAAIAIVGTYGLATRLFPDQLGVYEPIAGSRLFDPVGYWNAFGILAAMGTLLALGLAARSGPVVRCAGAASTVVLLLVLYFTFSRGGWIAFFCGLAAAVVLDRRRLQLITTAFVVAPWPALAIWAASTSPALTHTGSALDAATSDGHGLAVIAILLVVAAALAILALDWLQATVSVPYMLQRFYAGTLLFLVAASLIVVFGRYGTPPTLARKAYDAFNQTRVDRTDLNSRLFNLSGSGRTEQFHTAWQQAGDHPVLGGGAGSFDEYWFQHRRVPATVHDAHNLYLETLAELGPVGLALLAVMLVAPLAAVRRARSSPLAAVAFAAYVAFLLHAGIDWDWEMPTVTLTALFCGLALLALGRGDRGARPLRPVIRWGTLGVTGALIGFTLLGLLGNAAISGSSKSTNAGNYSKAESQARRAMDFAPWSAEPWRRLGEAQVSAGKLAAARESFREAIAKDRGDWTLWFQLAEASTGRERARALVEASRLNPLSPEIADAREGSG
jgi:tetratricopeptide (TPR) repeat protein